MINELRLGNSIMRCGEVINVTATTFIDMVTFPEDYAAMPLNADAISALGFSTINPTSSVYYRDGIHLLLRDGLWIYEGETTKIFSDVHTLQNFLFAVCNVNITLTE